MNPRPGLNEQKNLLPSARHLEETSEASWGGPSGAHGTGYMGLAATTCVPIGVTERPPQPIPGVKEGFQKKSNFRKFSRATKLHEQRQCRGFWVAHGPGDLVATDSKARTAPTMPRLSNDNNSGRGALTNVQRPNRHTYAWTKAMVVG